MLISIIVSTYNWPEALERVLVSLNRQKSAEFEVSDDIDAPYHKGIFVDVFPYDHAALNERHQSYINFYAKKIIKLKRAKKSSEKNLKSSFIHKFASYFFSLKSLERAQQNLIARLNKNTSNILSYGYNFSDNGLFPKDSIFPLTRVTFEDASFPAPGDYHRFLTMKYGDYMKLPPESERVMIHSQQLIPDYNPGHSDEY